jgi:YcxB-like protein
MYVKFEFTQEDLIDASQRSINRGNLGRSKVWNSSSYSAVSVGVITFFFLRNSPTIGLLVGLLVAGIIILISPQLEKRELENRLRRIVAEMMPNPGPYVCEVEIRSEGVWVRSMNKQTIHEWPNLKAIEETSDSVDIFTHDGGGVVVRNRAFTSEDQRRQFIEIARSGLTESRS